MDKRQRTFLFAAVGFVIVFVMVLLLIRAFQKTPESERLKPTASVSLSPTIVRETLAPSLGLTMTPSSAESISFFVSPAGDSKNDGTKEHPWSLQYALYQPKTVKPGDTIWLLDGKYTGTFTSQLNGEKDRPITVRAFPGARAILQSDGLVLDIASSAYVNFWGLEITATQNPRDPSSRQETAFGVRINQGKPSHDIKFINMLVYDMPAQGFGWWQANTDSVIYGSLIFFNGVTQFDHGIYVHNSTGKKSIIDNIIFDNASHGIHAYGEKDYQELNNLYIEGNTVFDNGSIGYSTTRGAFRGYGRNILVGGNTLAQRPVVTENYTYFPTDQGEAFNLGYRAGSNEAVVKDNYFANGSVTLGGSNSALTMEQNTIIGFNISNILHLGGNNRIVITHPNENKVFIRPNQYEPGRANITIYNWTKQSEVSISAEDLRGVQIKKGDAFELHNAQDFFNDVIKGSYDGNEIVIPMNKHTVEQPLGLSFKPPSTFPVFGAFVLITLPSDR